MSAWAKFRANWRAWRATVYGLKMLDNLERSPADLALIAAMHKWASEK